jgi:hypothetical protein
MPVEVSGGMIKLASFRSRTGKNEFGTGGRANMNPPSIKRLFWRVIRALREENRRSIEIHNRAQEVLDERYRRYPYYIRGIF